MPFFLCVPQSVRWGGWVGSWVERLSASLPVSRCGLSIPQGEFKPDRSASLLPGTGASEKSTCRSCPGAGVQQVLCILPPVTMVFCGPSFSAITSLWWDHLQPAAKKEDLKGKQTPLYFRSLAFNFTAIIPQWPCFSGILPGSRGPQVDSG